MSQISREAHLKSRLFFTVSGWGSIITSCMVYVMFPCSSGFVLVVFSWERGLINRKLAID